MSCISMGFQIQFSLTDPNCQVEGTAFLGFFIIIKQYLNMGVKHELRFLLSVEKIQRERTFLGSCPCV